MKKNTENTEPKSKRRNTKSRRISHSDRQQARTFNGANHTTNTQVTNPINGQSNAGSDTKPKTSLGRELMKIRQEIVASGEPLLSWDEVNREVARRRGEVE